MRRPTIDERVRDYVEAEREQEPVSPMVAARIIHALAIAPVVPRRPRLAFARVAVATAAMLLLGTGVALTRVVQMPAGIEAGSWSSGPSMATPRAYQTATLLPNGKVLVVGGRGLLSITAPWQPPGSAISSAELFNPKTRHWSSAGTLNAPRFGHTATLLGNGKVLIAGGNSIVPNASLPAGADTLSSAELYDPQSNSWSLAASMHTARASHTATLLADGRVLVAGGIVSSAAYPGFVLNSAELYDPSTNRWTTASAMLSPRANQSATLLSDHRVLLIGGIDHFWNGGAVATIGLTTAELFAPTTDSWSPAPSMHYQRISQSGTLLPDGRVLVVGDTSGSEQTSELFDATAERWSVGPKPTAGRVGHLAVLLHDGAVLIAGGLGDNGAQLFDGRRNVWVGGGSLARSRTGATATVLDSGQVLVAGGFGSTSVPWSSAEIYDPHGTSVAGVSRVKLAPAPIAGTAVLLGILAVLLGVVLWLRRRNLVRKWQAGEIWVE